MGALNERKSKAAAPGHPKEVSAMLLHGAAALATALIAAAAEALMRPVTKNPLQWRRRQRWQQQQAKRGHLG